jgi:putative phage-type endonuclease
MQTHKLQQGTPEWHAHRARHFNASDAPAMMGVSPYETRTELIKRLATGISKEVTAEMHLIFAEGHRSEALARPLAEEIVDDDLYPVTGTNGKYSASFDGLTMDRSTAFEHKSLNAAIRAALPDNGQEWDAALLPEVYTVQMEQQCLVSGCERVLFLATKWDGDTLVDRRQADYRPNAALRARIVAGWAQLEIDVAAYVPVEVIAKVVPAPVQTLPAVMVRLSGALTVATNLPEISIALRAFIGRMVPKPSTDQQFADADAECKALKKVEDALDAAENTALAEMTDVDAMRRLRAELHALARTTRLAREKQVAAEKVNRKTKIVTDGQAALKAHWEALNVRLGKAYMPEALSKADFGGAIAGKKNFDNMEDAIATLLAASKIAANEKAELIQANLTTLRELGGEHKFLFIDAAQLVLKANDDLTALIKNRLADHKREEDAKEAATRDRIRREEEERANRLARERQAEQQRQAEAAERDRQAAARQEVIDAAGRAQAGIAEARVDAALPAPLLDGLSDAAAHGAAVAVAQIDAGQVIAAAQRAAPAPAAEETGSATLLIGGINRRLGYDVSAIFLKHLGFEPARIDGARRFYRDSDLPRIGRAIAEHTIRATQLQTA